MPELPEVETIVRDLRPRLKGRLFSAAHASVPQLVVPGLPGLEKVFGEKVLDLSRRGKFINIHLSNDNMITLHLRMSGRVFLKKLNEGELPHERTRLDFEDVSLRFCDMRKFGRVWVSDMKNYEKLTGILRLGVEPLSEDFSLKFFGGILEGRRGVLKNFLLRQDLFTGVGNIYADEACFYAGLKPERRLETLSKAEVKRLFESVVKALEQGVRNRGTSISDFADAYGKSGTNQELLFVYGRGGKECLHCKTLLTKTRVAGRGTVFCKKCQN